MGTKQTVRTSKKWTVEEVRLLRRMANGQYTASEIAEKLPGRSKDAVRAKIVSLRLGNRILSEEEKRRRQNLKPKRAIEIERSLYAQRALDLFKKKYPSGTPHENTQAFGREALEYWLVCVDKAHKLGLEVEQ